MNYPIPGDIHDELIRARAKFPEPFHSTHEGIAVIWEEFEELKAEVFKQDCKLSDMYDEAIQLAAMAVRFIEDLL